MHSETNAREDEHQHERHGTLTADSASVGKETLVLLLEVNYQGEYTAQTIEYGEWDRLTVGDIRRQLESAYSLSEQPAAEPESTPPTWLVWKGRRLRDPELAKDLGNPKVHPSE